MTLFPPHLEVEGSAGYTAASGALSVEAVPFYIAFPDGHVGVFFGTPPSIRIGIQLDESGHLVGGDPERNDFELSGMIADGENTYEGVLLTGEIVGPDGLQYGWPDRFDLRFTIVGGALAFLYGGLGAEFGVRMTGHWVRSTSEEGPADFSVDSQGSARVSVGRLSLCSGEIGGRVVGIPAESDSVTVRLLDAHRTSVPLASQQTDPTGDYRFTGLCTGDYLVEVDETTVDAPSQMRWCRPPFCHPGGSSGTVPGAPEADAEALGDMAHTDLAKHGSQASLTSDVPATSVTLSDDAQQQEGVDFLVSYDIERLYTSYIAGGVWTDSDGNGQRSADEPTLTSLLYLRRQGVLYSILPGGPRYRFSNLPDDWYSVCVVAVPPAHRQTFDLDFPDTPNCSPELEVGLWAPSNGVDFGYEPRAALHGRLWADVDANGNRDDGEPGLDDWPVTWIANDDTGLELTWTTSNGRYAFEDMAPGEYRLCVGARPGFLPTWDPDSPPVNPPPTPNCTSLLLAPGEARVHVDFGYAPLQGIGGRAWFDLNGDGSWQRNEVGLSDFTARLYRNGSWFRTSATDAWGDYFFGELGAGPSDSFKVCVSGGGDLYRQTYDLDFPSSPGCSPEIRAPVNGRRDDVDFGFQYWASAGGVVWQDLDFNGAQDAGEPVLQGWTVQLHRPDGRIVPTSTDAEGRYTCSRLVPGTYSVCVVPRSGFAPTSDWDSPAGIPLDTPNCATVTLTTGQFVRGLAFGYAERGQRPWSSVGNRVWEDLDADGLQDLGEPGLAGVLVTVEEYRGPFVMGTVSDDQGAVQALPARARNLHGLRRPASRLRGHSPRNLELLSRHPAGRRRSDHGGLRVQAEPADAVRPRHRTVTGPRASRGTTRNNQGLCP